MKNSIWVGMNCKGDVIASFVKPQFTEDGLFTHNGRNLYANCHFNSCFALDLKPLEIVELIYDTETGSVEIKREREIGWYLTLYTENACSQATARHWDGNNWRASRKPKRDVSDFSDEEIAVISDKLPYNEHLKGLE